MLRSLVNVFSSDIGIDLGTANTIVLIRGRGIVLREPSVVAVHSKSGRILAVGLAAKEMLGKTPSNIITIRPLREGAISDFNATTQMLSHFLGRTRAMVTLAGLKIFRPRVVLGVPSGITAVEKKAVSDAALDAGAGRVFLLEEPMAAAIGAGLPIESPIGSMIVDLGGGTTEIAVISLGGIVVNKSLRVAGDRMDQAVIDYAKRNFHLLLGESMAERIKIALGSAVTFEGEEEATFLMRGRDLETGLPKSLEVNAWEIREALSPVLEQIVHVIKEQVELIPPELIADVIRSGITLAGGSSQVRGLADLILDKTGIPASIAEDPMACVVQGCGKALEDPALLEMVSV